MTNMKKQKTKKKTQPKRGRGRPPGALNETMIKRLHPALVDVIKRAGGVYALADRLKMWFPKLYGWLSGKHAPSKQDKGYRALSKLVLRQTGVTLEEALSFAAPPAKAQQPGRRSKKDAPSYLDETAMIARLDVVKGLERLAAADPKAAEVLRRYHGIDREKEDYAAIAKDMKVTSRRVQFIAREGRASLARMMTVTHRTQNQEEPMEARGWTWAINSKNWHYFIVGLASCGSQVKPGDGDLDDDPALDNSPGNCPGCRREVAKMRANVMNGINIAKGAMTNENRID